MSSPLRTTFPSTLAFGIVSCIRFRQRINVDLPQPDGPMIAETACSSKSNVMSSIAFFGPYHADTLSVRIFAAIASSPRDGTKPDHDPRHDGNAEHHEDKDQGGPPGGLVQGRVRAEREHVDRVRQRLARLIQTLPPKRAPEARHEERRRFAADPRDPEQRPGNHGAARGRQHDPEDRSIPRNPQGERRLARRDGHETQRLLGGPRDEGDHDRRQGDDPRGRAEDEPLAHDSGRAELEDEGEREDADHDGGDLGHDVDEEPDRGAEAILPVFGQIDPGQDADRECDHGGEGDEDESALDRISDAAIRRREREETRSDGAEAADGGLEEEAPEGDECEDHAQKGGDVHRDILPSPPGVPIEPEHHAAPSPRRRTRPSISRAKTLMRSDISMRTSPSSMRALSSSGSVAFRKLFAIQLAMVCPWSKSEMEIALRFPIVIVTAIVSPTARPRPRMVAPKIPARAYRRTATRVVSQRVAPRLKAASRWLSGTARRASRETAEMVGMIMTARMTPAVNLSVPMGFPWKMGRNPKMLWTTGSTEARMAGPRTKIPHNPYTTDGTAASSSTTYVSGIRSHGGESSERKIAMPRLIGTPNRRASAEVTSVPYTNGTAPKTKGGTGFQTLPVRNPRPNVRMESCAARVRMIVIRTRSPTTPNATAVENH